MSVMKHSRCCFRTKYQDTTLLHPYFPINSFCEVLSTHISDRTGICGTSVDKPYQRFYDVGFLVPQR